MIREHGKSTVTMPNLSRRFVKTCAAFLVLCLISATGQVQGSPAQNTTVQPAASGIAASYPELVDITASTGIQFEHLSSPEQKFIVESMSGGVAIIDYDGDGWPDIYFTNAQNVDMALHGKKAQSALYHNNHDGTF